MPYRNIPEDLNVELLLTYFSQKNLKITMKGQHKRNAYKDILQLKERHDGTLEIEVARDSLYNALPEYMFHPIDRFSNLPPLERTEKFEEEFDRQEKEKEHAYKFFAPVDIQLLLLKSKIRERLHPLTGENTVLQKLIVGEAAFEHLSQGRFTRRVLPFLPYCRIIRGEKTYITLLLRKVFVEESLQMECKGITSQYWDEEPRYEYQLGMTLDEGYIGNEFDENVITYIIHYWSAEDCDKDFEEVFLRDIEQLRNLIEKFFISIEETFRFDISHDESPLTLSDDENFYYLDYNTNI